MLLAESVCRQRLYATAGEQLKEQSRVFKLDLGAPQRVPTRVAVGAARPRAPRTLSLFLAGSASTQRKADLGFMLKP